MNNETKEVKIYRLYGIENAIELLRPEATWEINGSSFTKWEDERPAPTWAEVTQTMDKLKALEDSVKTIWTKKQLERLGVS